MPPCSILVNLSNIQALFNPYTFHHDDSESNSNLEDPHFVHINAYPLVFLRTIGNIQTNGIPSCFYPLLTNINNFIRKRIPLDLSHSYNHHHSKDNDDDDVSSINMDDSDHHDVPSYLQAIKPVSTQFYNYITHHVMTCAGKHNSQQGIVTTAISGAFANTQKHKTTTFKKQSHCNQGLPLKQFHDKISLEDCPISLCAEFIYFIDIRALKTTFRMHVPSLLSNSLHFTYFLSYSFIFNNIILPLAKSWKLIDIHNTIKDYLIVLKLDVSVLPIDFIISLLRSFLHYMTGLHIWSPNSFGCFIKMKWSWSKRMPFLAHFVWNC